MSQQVEGSWKKGHVDAIPMIETHGSMDGRLSVRTHRQDFMKVLLKCVFDPVQIVGSKGAIPIEPLHDRRIRRRGCEATWAGASTLSCSSMAISDT